MPRNYVRRPTKHWSQKALEDALVERREQNTPLRKLAKKYNIPKSSLEKHVKAAAIGKTLTGQGSKPVFNENETANLRECIVQLASLGFGMRRKDIAELVESYVLHNDHERGKKILKYKKRPGYPGPDWLTSFIKKNNLSLKEATKLSRPRYNATKNPFVVYHYFDLLEKTISNLGLENKPEVIWNCDESGLPHEPKKLKIVSGKGQKTFQVTPGADRENTTVMAACSAAGQVLPPMIVFQGKFVQTTWKPNHPSNYEFYPWLYANQSGWMDSDTFYKWFEEWEKQTRQYQEQPTEDSISVLEPRLLIYDGHLSHVWYGTLELARQQKVTIIKLPPHTTDLLQPLDVAVFKSLKDHWGDILFQRFSMSRNKLTKSEFATVLSGEDVWKNAFTPENIKQGFRKCGISPPNRKMYPEYRFHQNLLKRYNTWVDNGKPDLAASELDSMEQEAFGTQSKNSKDGFTTYSLVSSPNESGSATPISYQGRTGKIIQYFVPDDEPGNLIRIESSEINIPTTSTPSSNENFQSLVLKRLDKIASGPAEKQNVSTRRKVNPYGEIVTSDKSFEDAEVQAKKKGIKKSKIGASSKASSSKEYTVMSTSESGSEDPEVPYDDSESALGDDDDEIFINNPSKPEFPPTCEDEGYAYLHSVWDELNPPIPEQSIIGKYFGLIYYTDESRKKSQLFVGKVIRRFCQDAKGPAQFLEFECLKYASGTPTVLEKSPSHFDREIDLIPAWDIICGPMSVTPETDAPTSTIRRMTSGKYFVPEYPNLVKTSFIVLKLDREKEYERVYFS